MQDVFSKLAKTQASQGGNYIRDGIYTFDVEKVQVRQGHNGTSFIAELRVIECAPNEPGVDPNPPGSVCSMVCNLTKHDSAWGNAKAFVEGALGGLGYKPEDITEDVMREVCSASQPLRGVRVKDTTYRKSIKSGPNAGKPITLHRWESVAQTEEQLFAQRAALDSTAPAPSAPMDTPDTTPEPAAPAPSAPQKSGGILDRLKS